MLMSKSCLAALLLILCLNWPSTNAHIHRFNGRYGKQLRRDYIFDRMMGIEGGLPPADDEKYCQDDPTKQKILTIDWFNQTLDHFATDPAKAGNWLQHYQVNDKFFNKTDPNPIVFLMIGGEGPILTKWVCFENYTYMQAAQKYHAKVIQLEHRFFGKNKGLKDLSYNSLQMLTTEQAMADINSFIEGYNKMNNWTNARWIGFGGSYPGTIAALLRLKYPNITNGNIASSAPLQMVVDFWQYGYVMENTIRATGQQCYDDVKEAFALLIKSTLSSTGRRDLNNRLKIQPPLNADSPDKNDIDTVTSDVFSAFQGAIQYTFDGAAERFQNQTGPRMNIFWTCKLMTDKKTTPNPIDRLYKVYQLIADDKNAHVIGSYKESIKDFLNVALDGPQADMRGWMWLSCNEFGWLQSTSNNGLFGDVTPISLYIKQCSDMFENKLNATQIDGKIAGTSKSFGYTDVKEFRATNLFLPNGAFDPWSSLGVPDATENSTITDRANQRMVTRFTPEAAHCSDMYPPYPNEPKGLILTRQMFNDELDFYIGKAQAPPEQTTPKGGASSLVGSSILLFVACFWVLN